MEINVQFDPPRSTAQEKQYTQKNGRVIVYESKQAKAAKKLLRLVLAPYTPRKPLTGAVALYVTWRFPYKGKTHVDGEYKTTRPDTDNLNKALKDVMTGLGYWKDDALVAREHRKNLAQGTPRTVCADRGYFRNNDIKPRMTREVVTWENW